MDKKFFYSIKSFIWPNFFWFHNLRNTSLAAPGAELEILPLGSSGKILTPLGFLTKACSFKTRKLINKQAYFDLLFSLAVVVLMFM